MANDAFEMDLPADGQAVDALSEEQAATSRPRARARATRFGRSWWADRWQRALMQVIDPGRLVRGRAYARSGHVLSMDLQVGMVLAQVQGTQARPYRERIEIRTFDDSEWERAIEALSQQAIYSAQLLNGEMPHDIEGAFAAVGLPLFPASKGDLVTHCTCADMVQPCKHVAAVYLLLGERLDEDPFLLFTMRGRTREQIMAALRERRAVHATGPEAQQEAAGDAAVADKPLEQSLDEFWRMGDEIRSVQLRVAHPDVEMELLKVLGDPSFAEDDRLVERLAEVYRTVSQKALDVAFGR